MGFFHERHFSFGFWEIVFCIVLLISNGKKIKGNSVDIWKSSFASFDETESVIAEKLTVQLLILP